MGKKEKKPRETNKLSCSTCGKEFTYESQKIRHEQSHTTQFECKVCHKTFSFVSALKRHEKQHDRTGSVPCKECARSFRDDTLLRRHLKYAHTGTYTCGKCLAVFPSEQALRVHSKTHKASSERQYRCSHSGCDRTFNFHHHLKHHELTHSGTKQYYCNVCGKGFIQLYHLKSHLRNHAPETWIHCAVPQCNKRFATEYALKRHVATHKLQPSDIPSDAPLNFAMHATRSKDEDIVLCPICGELVHRKKMAKHSTKCVKPDIERIPAPVSNNVDTIAKEDSNDQTYVPNKELVRDDRDNCDKANNNEAVSNCKTVLGSCLAKERPNEACLCEQMTDDLDNYNEQLEIMITKETNVTNSGETTKLSDSSDNYNDNYTATESQCEGCACAPDCNDYKEKSKTAQAKCSKFKEIDVMPEIEYRRDGVIKLSENFDKSIELPCDGGMINNELENDVKTRRKTEISVPYNSCKAVLGNCIVSGNDKIGDGCFCARMVQEAQQATEQEIDEITIFNEDWSS